MRDMYRIMSYSDLNWAREKEGRNVYFCYIYSLVWHFVEEPNGKDDLFDTLMGTCLGKRFFSRFVCLRKDR